jgi:hypothetical protein
LGRAARRSTSPSAAAPSWHARPCVWRDNKAAPTAWHYCWSLVAEKIVCAVVVDPTAAPASVMIGGRCPASFSDHRCSHLQLPSTCTPVTYSSLAREIHVLNLLILSIEGKHVGRLHTSERVSATVSQGQSRIPATPSIPSLLL